MNTFDKIIVAAARARELRKAERIREELEFDNTTITNSKSYFEKRKNFQNATVIALKEVEDQCLNNVSVKKE